MSKGRGKKIAIKFDKALLGDVTGNHTAFTVTGMQKNPLFYGTPELNEYTVDSVERYPVATLYEDDFSGTLDGVEVGGNGVVLAEGTVLGYGENLCPNKTYLASSQYSSAYSVDKPYNNTGIWITSGTGVPAWTRIDYGSGITKTIRRLVLSNAEPERVNAFTFQGSSNGSDWVDIFNGNQPNSIDPTTHDFANETAYRYYRVYITSQHVLSRAGFRLIEQYEQVEVAGGYIELGTYTATTPADTLPENPRLKWTEDLPTGTSITAEYATNNSDTTPPETWTAVSESDLFTIDGDFLWLRYTLETEDTSKTPTLLSVWLEEAEAPPDTIILTMTEAGLFRDVEGDITVAYDQSVGNLTGTRPVASFEHNFTPVDLEPTPVHEHIITARGIPVVHLLPYNAPPDPDYEGGQSPPHAVAVTAGAISVTLTHIDFIDP